MNSRTSDTFECLLLTHQTMEGALDLSKTSSNVETPEPQQPLNNNLRGIDQVDAVMHAPQQFPPFPTLPFPGFHPELMQKYAEMMQHPQSSEYTSFFNYPSMRFML